MADKRLYRVLTPDGQLSHDSFVLASEQPDAIQKGCVLVVNERDGTQLTTHRDRLFSIAKVGERKTGVPAMRARAGSRRGSGAMPLRRGQSVRVAGAAGGLFHDAAVRATFARERTVPFDATCDL